MGNGRIGIALVFIAHDLAVVRHVSHRVAVMYLGKLVEQGTTTQVYDQPQHPYTQALLAAAPVRHPRDRAPERVALTGDPPSPIHPPAGCRFHTRCPIAEQICTDQAPTFDDQGTGHLAACHFAGNGTRS